MQYVIRSFDTERGQITVEYEGQWTYAIDLPVEDGAFPVGEKLEALIQSMAPVWLLERQQALAASPANTDQIQALVQPYPDPPAPQYTTTPEGELVLEAQMQSDIEFISEIVNDVLAAKGL